MSLWVLVQVLINLSLLAAVGTVWVRLKRPPSEDPRLSRGLQLLQSKIAILEDLSDRTDTQVRQLNSLLEGKCVEVQNKIADAEKVIRNIEASRQKSMEVAKIFEDKIPHQEIVERQNTMKYVKAARLAHQGVAISEIMKQVDLSQAEVEFIAKVNRDHLMFSEENLPEWVQEPAVIESDDKLRKLGEEFKKAVQMAEQTNSLSMSSQDDYSMPKQNFIEIEINKPAPQSGQTRQPMPLSHTATSANGQSVHVRPFEFPKI